MAKFILICLLLLGVWKVAKDVVVVDYGSCMDKCMSFGKMGKRHYNDRANTCDSLCKKISTNHFGQCVLPKK